MNSFNRFISSYRFMAFDVETSSIVEEKAHIVEIAAVPFTIELNKKGAFTAKLEKKSSILNTRVDPQMPIEPEASCVHGICDGDVIDKPTRFEAALKLKDLGKGAVWIAHNAAYDIKAIHRALTPHIQYPKLYLDSTYESVIDTWRLAKLIAPPLQNLKLGSLFYHYNCPKNHAPNHSALQDVYALIDVFVHLLTEFNSAPGAEFTLGALVSKLYAPNPPLIMQFGKHKGTPIIDLPMDYLNWLVFKRDRTDQTYTDPEQDYAFAKVLSRNGYRADECDAVCAAAFEMFKNQFPFRTELR